MSKELTREETNVIVAILIDHDIEVLNRIKESYLEALSPDELFRLNHLIQKLILIKGAGK